MYLHRVWPVIVVLTALVLAWAMFPQTGWFYVSALLGMAVALALASAMHRAWSSTSRRALLLVAMAICTVATGASGFLFADPMTSVPFLAGIGGCVAVWRSIPGEDRPGMRGSGAITARGA